MTARSLPMRIIPVIDVLGGVVVRGVAGRRAEYKPLVSRLTDSTEPLEVARALAERFGFGELYLADLDAIAGGPSKIELYAELGRTRRSIPTAETSAPATGRVMVDAGVRDVASALSIVATGVEVVVGLETLAGPGALGAIAANLPVQRLVFSLDLKAGRPMGAVSAWGSTEPAEIAARAVELGVRRMIVLDLARVGTGEGVGTEELIRELRRRHPKIELIGGGGVRGPDDLRRLGEAGADAALVASALHDGRIESR